MSIFSHVFAGNVIAIRPAVADRSGLTGPADRSRSSAIAFLTAGPFLALALTAALAYFVGAVIGLQLRVRPSTPSLIWPPNAILTALLLYVPVRRWWAVFAGVAVAHVAIAAPVWPPALVIALFVTNGSEALMAAGSIRLLSDEPTRLDTLRRVGMFLVVSVAAPFLSTFLDAGAVWLFNHEDYWHVWQLRFLSNTLAQLAVVPSIIALVNSGASVATWSGRRVLEAASIAGGLVIIALTARTGIWSLDLSNVVLTAYVPLLLWAAIRFGTSGIGLSVLGTVLVVAINTFYGGGLLYAAPSPDRVIDLQVLLLSRIVPLMLLAAFIEEWWTTADALRASDTLKSSILTALPDLMFVLRRDGTYLDYHAKDPSVLFVSPSTFVGKTIPEVLPPDVAAVLMDALERAALTDETVVVEFALPIGDRTRQSEGRIVRMGDGRLLMIVRDISDVKRAGRLVHDLVGRLVAAQESERHRIAQELHDNLGQKVALLSMGIEQFARAVGDAPERARELTDRTRDIALDIHNLSHELHPSNLEMLGLAASLRSLCKDMSGQTAVDVHFTHDPLPEPMAPALSLSLYRITQEALHNVARHSGASAAQVRLTVRDGVVTLHIEDAGAGFHLDDQHEGLGLVSMRERATYIDGTLTIDAQPGLGTRVVVRVRLPPRSTP